MNTQTLVTPAGTPVPNKYANLGVTRGFDPGPASARRIFLLGFPGEGKTTFLSSVPGALILDFEDSGRDIQNAQAPRFGPRWKDGKLVTPTWADYKAMVKTVCEDPARPFTMIGFDTVDSMSFMAGRHLCTKWTAEDSKGRKFESPGDYGSEGAGWAAVRTEIENLLEQVTQAGLGYVIVGHLKQDTLTDGTVVHSPAVSEAIRRMIFRRTQYILYASREKTTPMKTIQVKVGGKQVSKQVAAGPATTTHALRIRTMSGESLEKVRVPIVDRIDVEGTNGWAAFASAFETSVAAVTAPRKES